MKRKAQYVTYSPSFQQSRGALGLHCPILGSRHDSLKAETQKSAGHRKKADDDLKGTVRLLSGVSGQVIGQPNQQHCVYNKTSLDYTHLLLRLHQQTPHREGDLTTSSCTEATTAYEAWFSESSTITAADYA
ncbi:MAG TPA: hypothetical protein VMD58_00480 [Acidobacteriaceae bacterium]|nr:hypothetical protein [Acidobacteriaceae bacterium]